MTRTSDEQPHRATKLFVEVGGHDLADAPDDWLNGADGVVLGGDGARLSAGNPSTSFGACILQDVDPEDAACWRDRAGTQWVAGGGLDTIMRLRDAWPGLDWVPRVEVYRPETRFDFHRAAPGEGFSMYMPDTSAIQGFRICDTDQESLETWLSEAVSEGFRCVWLHSRDADKSGNGADIEMLERARRHFAGGRLWLSGGIVESRHLQTLAREGGAKAAVIPASVAHQRGCAALATALDLEPPERHPVAPAGKGAGCSRQHQSA